MFWNTLWIFCMFLVAAYQGLMRDCTATNITTKTVPAAVSPPINAGKSCPVNCLRGTCTFLDDGNIDCTDGCNDGYMGKMCDFPCMNKCSKCDRKNARVCIKTARLRVIGTRVDVYMDVSLVSGESYVQIHVAQDV
ncbi:uncharacterized protein LOC124265913 [Haliotis rubra]|uniref:uncharacterized protein LOC124265913 n=1 Tax=Haliotis rubra TaxID=36100 RepID=UPI001EE5BD2E|nr:uncharacterized protein LOC124265913 [Haliotis rubra]